MLKGDWDKYDSEVQFIKQFNGFFSNDNGFFECVFVQDIHKNNFFLYQIVDGVKKTIKFR